MMVDDLDFGERGRQQDVDGLACARPGNGQQDARERLLMRSIEVPSQSDFPARARLALETGTGLRLIQFPALTLDFLNAEAGVRETAGRPIHGEADGRNDRRFGRGVATGGFC